MTALTKTGARQLEEAEAVIAAGLATFMDVGQALNRIREGRLYRADFATFDDYCLGRWQFSARRANQLMGAAQIGTTVPVENEAQARALAALRDDPQAQRAAYEDAASRGDVTAASLADAVARIQAPTDPSGSDQGHEPPAPNPAAGPDDDHQADDEDAPVAPAASPAPKVAPTETAEERNAREAEQRRLDRNVNFGKYLIGMWATLGDGTPIAALLDGWVPDECPMWLVDAHKPVFTADGIRAVAAVMEKLATEWESRV